MQKVVIRRPGGYDVLKIEVVDEITPREDEYCIDVKAAGVNYADVIVREGYYKAAKGKYPLTPGFEFSGTIRSQGKDANAFALGEPVFGYTLFGAYASALCVKAAQIRTIPTGWSFEEAASVPAAYLTAFHAVNNVARARPTETVLIHSAAGGVGLALVQLCKLSGCSVLGVVGSAPKIDVAKSFGADFVIVKGRNFWQEIDHIAPKGLDIVFDSNGITTPRKGFNRLRPNGRIVIYGFGEIMPRGKRPWLPMLAYNSLRVPRFSIRNLTSTNRAILGLNLAYLVGEADLAAEALDAIQKLMSENKIYKYPLSYFSFSEVALAHQLIESGNSTGKIVLQF